MSNNGFGLFFLPLTLVCMMLRESMTVFTYLTNSITTCLHAASRPPQAEAPRHTAEKVMRPVSEVKSTSPTSPLGTSPEAEVQSPRGMH